ncbi:hypothetical protein ACH4A8_19350 [Streptomyces vietnamensis]|uniref:hypothetical protein n=1 Tax=Streptomyces vietnamensis TaxID=362257 RepID=UPI003431E244
MNTTRTTARRLSVVTAAATLTAGLVLVGCDGNDTSAPASTSTALPAAPSTPCS